ncbi:endonuclease II [Serratia phage 4S]|nr:endonuclease II [Serratia phage 4S]
MKTLSEKFGFIEYAELKLNEDGNIDPIEVENKKNVVYAIAVNDELMYIGKTKNLKKRIGYYRTAINRKGQNSDTAKSTAIHEALYKGISVKFYARQCFNLSMTNELGTMSISTMDLEEPMFIKLYNPPWNTQHKVKS